MDGRPSPGPWRHRRVWLVPALRPAVFGGLDDPADRRAVLDWARAGRPFIGRGALPGDAPGGLPLGLALPPQPHKRRLSLTVAAAAVFGATRYEDRSRASRRLVYLYFASVVAHVAIAAMQFQMTHAQVDERLDLERRVAASSISRALVFVETPIGLERAMFPDDFTRNGIDFSATVLYALDRQKIDNTKKTP